MPYIERDRAEQKRKAFIEWQRSLTEAQREKWHWQNILKHRAATAEGRFLKKKEEVDKKSGK